MTFITAGFPTRDSTVPLMMALEAGGADIIELGMPFSDPIGDGPTIQRSNTVSSPGMLRAMLMQSDCYRERRRLPRCPGIRSRST